MGFVQKRTGWLLFGIFVLIGGIWQLTPGMTNHFYRADGYAFLHQALEVLGDEISEPDFCVEGGVTDPQALNLLVQAVGALEQAREARPTDAQTLILLGRAYCLTGSLEEAVEAYEGYSELRPESPLGWLEGGFAHIEGENFEEAVLRWRSHGLSQALFVEAGKKMAEAGDFTRAITWLKNGADYFPQTADATYELGMVYYKNQQWELALGAFDSALKHGVFQTTSVGDVYYQKGLIYQSASGFTDFEQAFEMYKSALETERFSSAFVQANVYYKRGEIYLWMNDHREEAIADFREAISLYPDHYLAHLRLGSTLYQTSGDVQQAEAEILQAIELWPNLNQKEWPYRVLGEIYASTGWTEKAIAAFQEALRINPQDTKAQFSLKQLQAPDSK